MLQAGEKRFPFMYQGLADIVGGVQLRARLVLVGFEVQVGGLQKLSKDNGRGCTLEIGRSRRQESRSSRGAPNGAFSGIYGKAHAICCGGSSINGFGGMFGFDETGNVVDVCEGESLSPFTCGKLVELLENWSSQRQKERVNEGNPGEGRQFVGAEGAQRREWPR